MLAASDGHAQAPTPPQAPRLPRLPRPRAQAALRCRARRTAPRPTRGGARARPSAVRRECRFSRLFRGHGAPGPAPTSICAARSRRRISARPRRATPLIAPGAALHRGDIDLLSRNAAITYSRRREPGRRVVGHQLLRPDLHGAPRLVRCGAARRRHDLRRLGLERGSGFQDHNMRLTVTSFARNADALAAYEAERCDVLTGGIGALAVQRRPARLRSARHPAGYASRR